jgi:hypothetical protein
VSTFWVFPSILHELVTMSLMEASRREELSRKAPHGLGQPAATSLSSLLVACSHFNLAQVFIHYAHLSFEKTIVIREVRQMLDSRVRFALFELLNALRGASAA